MKNAKLNQKIFSIWAALTEKFSKCKDFNFLFWFIKPYRLSEKASLPSPFWMSNKPFSRRTRTVTNAIQWSRDRKPEFSFVHRSRPFTHPNPKSANSKNALIIHFLLMWAAKVETFELNRKKGNKKLSWRGFLNFRLSCWLWCWRNRANNSERFD